MSLILRNNLKELLYDCERNLRNFNHHLLQAYSMPMNAVILFKSMCHSFMCKINLNNRYVILGAPHADECSYWIFNNVKVTLSNRYVKITVLT